ncbi:hypothetical protein [Nonomuraea typhae]|uniref:hypothetical protein n=1 Tax=Nonomuraea typhae TaxID=2603600 RepID=UPI0012F97FD9|nr:hypothetical protein [Nonomuraea typhae]
MTDYVNVDLTEDDDEGPIFRITGDGAALNLTGATVVAIIKASQHVEDDASSGVYTLTSGSGLTVTSPTQGLVQLTIPDAVTESPSIWFYKIRVTSGSPATTKTAIAGWLSVANV